MKKSEISSSLKPLKSFCFHFFSFLKSVHTYSVCHFCMSMHRYVRVDMPVWLSICLSTFSDACPMQSLYLAVDAGAVLAWKSHLTPVTCFVFFCRFSFFFGSFVFVFHFHCLGHRALCCLSQHISHFECYSHRNKWHLCHLSICLSIYTSIHPYMQHAPVAHLSSLAEKTQTNWDKFTFRAKLGF